MNEQPIFKEGVPSFSFKEKSIDVELQSMSWSILIKGVKLGSSFLVLGYLSLYQYGVYQLLTATQSFLASFIGFGGSAVTPDIFRYVGDGKAREAKRLYWEFNAYRALSGIILWAVTFFGASLFSFRFGPEFIGLIKLMSFLFLHDIFFDALKTPLKIEMRFGLLGSRTFISKIIYILILLYFIFFGSLGLREVIISDVLAGFMATATLVFPAFVAYRPWRHVPMAKEWIIIRVMKAHGKWGVFRSLLTRASSSLEPWIVKVLLGTETVAVFTVAKTMLSVVKDFTPVSTYAVLLPLSMGDRKRVQRIYTISVKYLFVVALVLMLGGILFVPPLVMLLFPKYASSIPLFYVMILSLPIASGMGNVSMFLVALRKQKFLFFRKIIVEIASNVFLVTFILLLGTWGLVAQYILIPVLMFIVMQWYLAAYKPGIEYRWREIWSFGEEDKKFLRSMFVLTKAYIRHTLRI